MIGANGPDVPQLAVGYWTEALMMSIATRLTEVVVVITGRDTWLPLMNGSVAEVTLNSGSGQQALCVSHGPTGRRLADVQPAAFVAITISTPPAAGLPVTVVQEPVAGGTVPAVAGTIDHEYVTPLAGDCTQYVGFSWHVPAGPAMTGTGGGALIVTFFVKQFVLPLMQSVAANVPAFA